VETIALLKFLLSNASDWFFMLLLFFRILYISGSLNLIIFVLLPDFKKVFPAYRENLKYENNRKRGKV